MIFVVKGKGEAMPETITESQYEELMDAVYRTPEKFIKLLEDYTGIIAKQCVAYQFF